MCVIRVSECNEYTEGSPTIWHSIPQSSSIALLSLMMAERSPTDGTAMALLAHKGLGKA